MISPLGSPIFGDRPLDYFIAHEVTPQLTGEALDALRFAILPQYVREGYADYVGKGTSFQYKNAVRDLVRESPLMDYKKSGLYLRFNLLVAYLFDHRGWSVDKLLRDYPPQVEVEGALLEEQIEPTSSNRL